MGMWHCMLPSWESSSEPVHTWGRWRRAHEVGVAREVKRTFLYLDATPGKGECSYLRDLLVGGAGSKGWNIRQRMAYCPEPGHLNSLRSRSQVLWHW